MARASGYTGTAKSLHWLIVLLLLAVLQRLGPLAPPRTKIAGGAS